MFGTEAAIHRGGAGGYQIENACLFLKNSTTRLERTAGSATQRNKWTMSAWVKRASFADGHQILSGTNDSQNFTNVGFRRFGTDNVTTRGKHGNADRGNQDTLGQYRDAADWMHIVVQWDVDQPTNDGVKIYVDGIRQDDGVMSTVAQNSYINNSGTLQRIGHTGSTGSTYFDGYMAEVVFIDGSILAPEVFGEWNSKYPTVWQPRDLSHVDFSGNNSFYLNFADPNDLGKDVSGNANSWSRVNITSANHVTDTPTSNCCTWNPNAGSHFIGVLTDGNRRTSLPNSVQSALSTMSIPSTGKWYFEFVAIGGSANSGRLGLSDDGYVNYIVYNGFTGDIITSGTGGGSYGNGFGNGSVIGVAVDSDAGTVEFINNGVSQGVFSGSVKPAGLFAVAGIANAFADCDLICNENDLNYAPPSGYKTLEGQNLPYDSVPNPKEYFDPVTYVGTGNSNFIATQNKVDFVLSKQIFNSTFWPVNDSVRGAGNISFTNSNEQELVSDSVQSFDPVAGYTVGTSSSINQSGRNFVAYPITKSPIAGMDIQTYTGDKIAGKKIAHNLGVKPQMVIVKARTTAEEWTVYFEPVGATHYLQLDTTIAATALSTVWNDTEPDAAEVTLGTSNFVNGTGQDYVMYLFRSIPGFSKVYSYTGNGNSNGPFVDFGFRPAFMMLKNTASVIDWYIYDHKRTPDNPIDAYLNPNLAAAQGTQNTMDWNSNGFKMRRSNTNTNQSGATFVGIAFAEVPFGMRGK